MAATTCAQAGILMRKPVPDPPSRWGNEPHGARVYGLSRAVGTGLRNASGKPEGRDILADVRDVLWS